MEESRPVGGCVEGLTSTFAVRETAGAVMGVGSGMADAFGVRSLFIP